jgi:hypothetical protein
MDVGILSPNRKIFDKHLKKHWSPLFCRYALTFWEKMADLRLSENDAKINEDKKIPALLPSPGKNEYRFLFVGK